MAVLLIKKHFKVQTLCVYVCHKFQSFSAIFVKASKAKLRLASWLNDCAENISSR